MPLLTFMYMVLGLLENKGNENKPCKVRYAHLRNVHEITCSSYSLSLRERVGERGFKLLKLFRARSLEAGITGDGVKLPWDDLDLLEIPAKTTDEPRSLVIGMINDKHWSGVITYRGSRIRIISVRRSRKEEVALYES